MPSVFELLVPVRAFRRDHFANGVEQDGALGPLLEVLADALIKLAAPGF